ncbi:MAG TPA: hypothetical protein VFS49_07510 [Croceibacterium sp.]|nr:hypothetical protein [Croceibacterium sp.]
MLLLAVLAALLVLLFFGVLAYALVRISGALVAIGGKPTSYLAKLRMGLRAIEKETGHLAPQVVKINAGLTQIAGGLASVDRHLVGTIDAVGRQPGA